jgi:S1-C subfamily serine protease
MQMRHHGFDMKVPTRAMVAGACVLWGALAQAQPPQPARVRVRMDSSARDSVMMHVVVNTDAIERMVRELIASKQMEQSIGLALREASTGERVDARKIQELKESLQEIARRNAGLITTIQMQCLNPQPHPDGYIGVTFREAEITVRPNESPAYVLGAIETVEPGSPAEKAGILRDDVLLSVGGMDARKPIALDAILKPGAKVPVRLQRGRVTKDITVTVEKRPAGYGSDCSTVEQLIGPAPAIMRMPRAAASTRTPMPPMPGTPPGALYGGVYATTPSGNGNFVFSGSMPTIAGATMIPLDDDSRAALGVDDGMLVTKVAPGTPAREAGLRGLDVIVSADDERISSVGSLRRIVGNSKTGSVKLEVVRGGKKQTLTLRWQPGER